MSDLLRRAQEIFDRAVEVPAANRTEFVAEACGKDRQLQAEVESLLSHDSHARVGFMETLSPMDGDADRDDESVTATTPQVPNQQEGFPVITGYKILRRLHQGGQGVVYEALQRATKRKVAIKLLLGGSQASLSARKRFEREIDLVAQLKHPNIITLFDSGHTEEGHPFCVMDYIRGVSLSEYVRQRKLSLEGALRLFGQVCQAVQYAHQRGVIHRDLKPSNILVDGNGHPRVLDFGLAKPLITPEDTMVTVSRAVIGTLPYLSPEQARGNPDEIDIRTDVYALGVILYEILTGHYPYPVVGQLAEVLRNITDSPPTPPSRSWSVDSGVTRRSSRRLRVGTCPINDEVQTIVLKALAKERDRRYQSASDLARDIGHYLSGEAIEAKRDSFWYRVSKFVKRNRKSIGIAAAFLALIFYGIDMTLYNRNLRRGTNYDSIGKTVAESLEGGFGSMKNRISDLLTGRPKTLEILFEQRKWSEAIAELTSETRENPNDPLAKLRLAFATTMAASSERDCEKFENAMLQYRSMTASSTEMSAAVHDGLGTAFFLRARMTHCAKTDETWSSEDQKEDYQEAIEEYSRALAAQPDYLRAYSNRGHAYFDLGQWDKAVRDYQRATSLGPERLADDIYEDVWRTYHNFGVAQRIRGDAALAADHYEMAMRKGPVDPYIDVGLALALIDAGDTESSKRVLKIAQDKPCTDCDLIRKAVRCLLGELSPQELRDAAKDPGELCEAYYYGGESLLNQGREEEARRWFKKCVDTGISNYNEYNFAQWRLSQG